MAAKKCAFGFVGMLSLIGLAFCFQWKAVTQDYFHAVRNFGLFQQNADLKGGAVIWEATVSVGPRKGEAGDRSSDLRTAGTENFTYHLAEITNKSSLEVRNSLSECPENPPKLVGPLNIDLSVAITTDNVIDEYKDIEDGGRFRPADCSARQRIAIILPYRNRETHLTFWLHYLHSFLQRQQGDYGVYVIEQFGDATFNRAKLMNVGFNEAQNEYDYNCFVFSDIDIIPMDDRNLYRCGGQPRHMANAVDKFGFRLPYDTLFGGVVAFSKDQFLKINGYSNVFWGWGGEDDELYQRVVAAGMRVERPDKAIARSKMIVHHRDPGNESNGKSFPLIDQAARRMHADGLSTLQYKVLNRTKHKLYNKISVDIGHP